MRHNPGVVRAVAPQDPVLERILAAHPHVELVAGRPQPGVLEFHQGPWARQLVVGDPAAHPAGLVELMDNNPLVCADRASVPGPVATLLLAALGPVLQAGLLAEPPVAQVAGSAEADDVPGFLGEVQLDFGDEDLGSVLAVNVIGLLAENVPEEAVRALYQERYAHSFYVREHGIGEWDTALVAGRPFAIYALSRTGDSLLTVRAMADRDGKCGAAQVVHAFNVMCGFEECLAIPNGA